jgi:hypothetical protein
MPPRTDPRIDAYIGKAQPFAQPILEHVRAVVHAACPSVEETINWGFPHFQYNGMLCSMAAFKAHIAFGFWRGTQVVPEGEGGAMGDFGRITSVKDLPTKRELTAYIKAAMALNDAAAPTPVGQRMQRQRVAAKKAPAPVPDTPEDLQAALTRTKGAATAFKAMSPSHRREYIAWIVEAKRAETRARRIATAVAQIAEGKSQNWKYER